MLPVAIFAILIGALELTAGVQELVYQGILNSRTYPLMGGTLGAVSGALILSTGISILRRSTLASTLAQTAAWVSVPTFVLLGVITRMAGWPATLLGMEYPLFVLAWIRRQPPSLSSTFH